MVPIETAVETEIAKSETYLAINLTMDIIFFIDILVGFNTSIENDYEEITDRKIISKTYLKGWFTVDLISALPVDSIASIFFEDLDSK